MTWRVAIPTYKRPDGLVRNTLAALERGGVDPRLIDVFVASEAEALDYNSQAVNQYAKATLSRLVVGALGMNTIRNVITQHYPDGQKLVQIDDDVRGVFAAASPKALVELTDLPELFDQGFEACSAVKARIWGMYPVCNPFYMHGGKDVTLDLRPIIGTLYGNINDRSHVLTCAVKSDIERTLLYFEKDGAVVRFNRMAPKQNARTEMGGHQALDFRTYAGSLVAAQALVARWPQWVAMKKSFKGGHAEVRLKA